MKNAKYAGRPSMCHSCRALVGANEQSCSACGAPKTSSGTAPEPQAAQRVYDHETRNFAIAILGRPYLFTILFLITNVFIFLLMWSSSGLNSVVLWAPPHETLIAYGAKLNYLINEGEWWRFVTPVFVHIGLAHLLINMYGLWMLGPYVERLYGSAKFVVLWVMTGIAGVVASYFTVRPDLATNSVARFLFKAGDGPSAGASGALFGLIGVLFVFGIKFRRELPEGFKRAFGTGLLPIILINLVIGFLGREFIGNAAHLGGLFSGTLFGLLISYKRPDEPPNIAFVWHALQFAALALVVISFVMVARNFRDSGPSQSQEAMLEQLRKDERFKFTSYLNALSEGDGAFVNAFNNGDKSGIEKAVRQLDQAPQVDERSLALRDELKSLLVRINELDVSGKEGDSQRQRARDKDRKSLLADFQSWRKKRIDLIKTEGGKYGLKLLEQPPAQPDAAEGK